METETQVYVYIFSHKTILTYTAKCHTDMYLLTGSI